MTDLICDADGIRLSPGVVLAERRGAAIVPRHAHDIFRLLAPEFGVNLDWVRLNCAVGRAARFLTEGRLDNARKAVAAVRLPQRLAKFNPNHYGPGPRGGQFAPAEGADAGAAPTRTKPIQVAQDERDRADESDAIDPMAPVRQALWNSSIRALRDVDPNNRALTYFTNPNSAPSQAALDQLNETLREAIARHATDSTVATVAARYPALAKPVLKQILQQYPAEYANARAAYLESQLTDRTQNHVTIAVGIAEDAQGARHILVSSSEQYSADPVSMRPQVASALRPDEIRVPAGDHAEINIIAYAKANNLRLIAVGAGRPYCETCGPALDAAGVLATGPRK